MERTPREMQIEWLRALIADFERIAYELQAVDEDPDATAECLRECRTLADELWAEEQQRQRCVAFEDNQPLAEFDVGGEAGGA